MNTHTPGAWRREPTNQAQTLITSARDASLIAVVPDSRDTDADADARLIAAAPELLALAKEVEQLITRDSDDLGFHLRVVPMGIDTVRALRVAIAKAEGR